jgi:apolipoprotein D and lipocalin family protein
VKTLIAVLATVALLTIFIMPTGESTALKPLDTVKSVDLDRFMGDWYVIANIPTFIETSAYNAIESYRLDADGTIDTVFTFRDGGFDGEPKRYNPRGFIRNSETNAEWGMRLIWPFKADFRVIYLDTDYRTTLIGRNKRDYVWVMAREPVMDAAEFEHVVQLIGQAGYDTAKLRMVPQRW